jgi:hypothetical protein
LKKRIAGCVERPDILARSDGNFRGSLGQGHGGFRCG